MGFGRGDGFNPVQPVTDLETSYTLKAGVGIEPASLTVANPSYTLSVS